ncbi:MAG: glycosyltransferase family 2 protein [Candidatus Omnitrophica bacterium]|nr:glycosyltransferase family 2 protein [Candidatus Omnitrophota bacterium]
MQTKRCDIIIPVWNASGVTAECVESIIEHTRYPYRLIIIDNGSDEETAGYLRALKNRAGLDVELIRNDTNLGFVKAANQGLRSSSAPYLCLMNNDTVATSGWLDEMISVAGSRPDIGIVNPSSNTFGQEPGASGASGAVQELYAARGFCMLIKSEVIKRIGFFDEIFNIGYFEETDFSFRAQAAGFRVVRAKGAYVHHKENVSFRKFKNNDRMFAENEKIFFSRWPRPVRVGYFIRGENVPEKVNRIAEDLAGKGHQVYLFLKRTADWPARPDHINIRRVDVDPAFFGLGSIAAVFKRRKKKKIEVIVTDNGPLAKIFLGLKRLHGSVVAVSPDAGELFEMVGAIAKGGRSE